MPAIDQLEQSLKEQVLDKAAALVSAGTNVSLLETVKLQAQVFLPVLKALRTEIGEERASQIAWIALRKWSHKLSQDIGTQLPCSPKREREAIHAALVQQFSSDLEAEMLRHEPDALESSINGYRFADFLRELEELELRSVRVCDVELDIAAVDGSDVRIESDARENEWCEVW